ncbi:hypothetical protein GCM10008959_26070 [Deinococcus seoulensis]|uniref:Cardiolipin synthase N-terminal domain-containing protein n=1 Tax=Deinococcus seoulensis TaxID=1837379 RepID=A0ABQ2RSK9_9DEIO|nr:hypothetical protein [Deinococcus seoulensis]GGR62807.1 hypothetical protein GCM10008959_26070 [Deinococcus seoulensis]
MTRAQLAVLFLLLWSGGGVLCMWAYITGRESRRRPVSWPWEAWALALVVGPFGWTWIERARRDRERP